MGRLQTQNLSLWAFWALVCVPHTLSATFLQVLYRESVAATSHEAGLPCHDFASFLLWLSGALSPAGLPPPQVPTMLPNLGL